MGRALLLEKITPLIKISLTLGKLLNLSELQFAHLQNGQTKVTRLTEL